MLKRFSLALFLLTVSSATLLAVAPIDVLQTASKKGAPALLLVTDPGSQNVDQARTTVVEAAKQIKDCVTVEMDRTDKANSELVTKYGLAGAPVPLILVFAGNGAIAGGVPSVRATPAALANMIPTPKKADVLQALQAGNAVMVVASTKAMKEKPKVVENCALTCAQMKGKATTIQVDLNDAAEKRFLGELKIDTNAVAPVTLVINQQGQITGTFNGPVDVATLAQATTKKAGGCCPSGSSASCAPPKK